MTENRYFYLGLLSTAIDCHGKALAATIVSYVNACSDIDPDYVKAFCDRLGINSLQV